MQHWSKTHTNYFQALDMNSTASELQLAQANELELLIFQQEKELASLKKQHAQEQHEFDKAKKANHEDFQLMLQYHHKMYQLFSNVVIRALTPIKKDKYAFANSGTLSRVCGSTPENSFHNTYNDAFLRRMLNEGLLSCVTIPKTGKTGKIFLRHYYYVAGPTDIETWDEDTIKGYLI